MQKRTLLQIGLTKKTYIKQLAIDGLRGIDRKIDGQINVKIVRHYACRIDIEHKDSDLDQ